MTTVRDVAVIPAGGPGQRTGSRIRPRPVKFAGGPVPQRTAEVFLNRRPGGVPIEATTPGRTVPAGTPLSRVSP